MNRAQMNIYLDIEGVILLHNSAATFADDFLMTIANSWPHTTYWVSSYARLGKDMLFRTLKPHLKSRTLQAIKDFRVGSWYELKTEAIDFTRPFLWFDDTLYPEEAKILEHYKATQCFRHIRLNTDPYQLLDEVTYLQSLIHI